ncbi:hypothetical protein K501DRAFT_253072 [Backusella circina FSU 941]|nr:hypothetical protein K501DRAFT_253072 [Backusella circina FSU 941]
MISNNNKASTSTSTTTKRKPMEVRFKMEPIGCQLDDDDEDQDVCHGRTRPTEIIPWWNPSNRFEKPPYTYATMIAHAILASRTGRLTLNDIYNWIAENYPYYKLGDKGWQNSVRHNLSLKRKWFVKTDRKPTKSHPGRGCYWMLQTNMEKIFVDFLSQNGKYGRKMSAIELYVMDSTSNPDHDAIHEAQNIQISRQEKKAKSPAAPPRIRNMSHDSSFVVPPPNTESRSFVFRVDPPENSTRHFRSNTTSRPRPKPGKRRKSARSSYDEDDDGNDSAVEMEYQPLAKRNKTAMQQDESTMTPDLMMEDLLLFDMTQELEMPYTYSTTTPEENLLYGLQAPGLQSEIRTIDVQTDSFAKQVHCPMDFDVNEFNDPHGYYYGMDDPTWLPPDFYESIIMPLVPMDMEFNEVCWPLDEFIQYDEC